MALRIPAQNRKNDLERVASADDSNTLYWVQSDLPRIEDEIREYKARLAEKEGAQRHCFAASALLSGVTVEWMALQANRKPLDRLDLL